MSDDLEHLARAQRGVVAAWERYERGADLLAKAALLSFLDMDEAGVERLAKAMFAQETRALDGWSWEGETRSAELRAYWLASARAVLSELRKMAGEKEA